MERKTLEELNNLIELEPNNAALYIERASIYNYPLRQFDNAIEDLNKAVELDPQNTDAYLHRAQTYQRDLNNAVVEAYNARSQ